MKPNRPFKFRIQNTHGYLRTGADTTNPRLLSLQITRQSGALGGYPKTETSEGAHCALTDGRTPRSCSVVSSEHPIFFWESGAVGHTRRKVLTGAAPTKAVTIGALVKSSGWRHFLSVFTGHGCRNWRIWVLPAGEDLELHLVPRDVSPYTPSLPISLCTVWL